MTKATDAVTKMTSTATKSISRRDFYISRRELSISRRDFYISRREIDFASCDGKLPQGTGEVCHRPPEPPAIRSIRTDNRQIRPQLRQAAPSYLHKTATAQHALRRKAVTLQAGEEKETNGQTI
ncbi:MAG TPA: hypothetical protein IAC71_02655 [Candidatus Caccomonas pullistercoris]|nr:hypothetical protein [Candidatus Caccomonas pullistercoris]